jgi:hypothetical protein
MFWSIDSNKFTTSSHRNQRRRGGILDGRGVRGIRGIKKEEGRRHIR